MSTGMVEAVRIEQMDFGGYVANYTADVAQEFSRQAQGEASKVLDLWARDYPKEPTWIQDNHQVPSLIARFDCFTRDDGTLAIVEIDDRPAGLGMSLTLTPGLRERFETVRQTWPLFRYMVGPTRTPMDDSFWLHEADDSYEGLVLVRSAPSDESMRKYVSRSVSTIFTEGDKSYGERLGLWSPVENESDLDFTTSFVLKPRQGTHARDVCIWIPELTSKARSDLGCCTQSQAKAALLKRPMYAQPFINPMESLVPGYRFAMFRVFFGYNLEEGNWVCLGGMVCARDTLRIHGAKDSIFYPAPAQ